LIVKTRSMSYLTSAAALLCLALPAAAGDVPIVATGVVAGNSLASGPFAGLAAGTPVTMSYVVTTPGFDIAPGQYTSHTIQKPTFVLDVGGVTAGLGNGAPDLGLTNGFPIADGFFLFQTGLSVSGHALECEMHDSTGTALSTTHAGSAANTWPGAAFDSVDWNVFGPGGLIGITLSTFTVHVDLASAIGTSFCTSTPNSSGGPASISALGCTSVSIDRVTLRADSLPPFKSALFFYGPSTTQTPLGDGFLCVTGSLFRLPAGQSDASGVITRALELDAFPAGSGAGEITSGSTWHFQCWYRDGLGVTNLTNGLSITFTP
jgi:hypothetical protein